MMIRRLIELFKRRGLYVDLYKGKAMVLVGEEKPMCEIIVNRR